MMGLRAGWRRPGPWCVGILASFDLACARPAQAPWVHPSEAQWRLASERLEHLRADLPRASYTAVVATVLHDPISGRSVDGRGAIAVAPGQGIRMILVGAAGATLLDAWVTPLRWRIAVPPAGIVRRGGADAPRNLPVAFLRWWFFARFEGALFAANMEPARSRWLLRDGDAVIDLRAGPCARGALIDAARRARGRAEHVEECRAASAPTGGDTVVYVDESSGLEVSLRVEEVSAEPPDPEAFRDPDEAESPTGAEP
jgi:hypothetical protein